MFHHLLVTSLVLLLTSFSTFGQVRNGWRSVYDKDGRLTRMNYYESGINVKDSNLFFQYHTDNILKAFISGIITPQTGEVDGSVALFDQSGSLTSYSIKEKGLTLFDVRCDYQQQCRAIWTDNFNVYNNDWACGDYSVQNNHLIIHNNQAMGVAVYNPDVPIDLNRKFTCKVGIPVEGNSAKQGLALGWKDVDNYYLFEFSFGKFYTVYYWENGEFIALTTGRRDIERPDDLVNEVVIRNSGTTLIFEINGIIEMVLPLPKFSGEQIALVTRSRGDAHFSNFFFTYDLGSSNTFFKSLWTGKGTGFFISPTRILTTYDVVADAKKIRVMGKIGGKSFVLPAEVIRLEESSNLAILDIKSEGFKAFDELPFGFSNLMPVSESMAFTLGYPNAISGIYMEPEVYEGKVLPTSTLTAGYRLLEMPFRFGMMGAPVFDKDVNLIGVSAYKGLDLKYSEIIDFYDNARIFKANLGKFDRTLESPLKNLPARDKIKALSEIVVIIESSVFDF